MTMTRPADTRGFTRPLLWAAGLLVAAMLLLASGPAPEAAVAQSGCAPTGEDTFTPGEPGEPPPGGVTIGPGESCPETEPVEPPVAEELPPDPRCDPCAKQRDRGDTISGSGSGGGATATTATTPSLQRLPFTGLDREKTGLLLSGIGMVAIGLGFALRRRTRRAWN